jgi:hypothetical protein
MREGMCPAREAAPLRDYPRHRVIIPVYIPNLEGYFARSLDVLKLHLESLRLTAGGKAGITIVSNDCAPEVLHELERQYREGWIDQLLLNRTNRGKVDAVVSVARGCFEPLITISDCDILFKPGWLEAIDQTFCDFPECGFASPFPNPVMSWRHTSATLLAGWARGELRSAKVVPDEDMDAFARSVGTPDFFKAKHRKAQIVLRRNGATAVVGAGHFVFTMRREALRGMPLGPALTAISPESDERWLDLPPDRLGYWRLALPSGHVYHIGNTPEPWMYDELERYRGETVAASGAPRDLPAARRHWTSCLPWSLRVLLIRIVQKTGLSELIPS